METIQTIKATKGQITDAIGKEVTQFFLKYFGHGPREIKTYIIEDIVVIRIIDDLRAFEKALLMNHEIADIATIKDLYRKTREKYIGELQEIISKHTGINILCSHHDISTKTGERIEVFILDSKF